MWAAANPARLTTTASGLHVVGADVGFAPNGTGGRWARVRQGTDVRYMAMCAQAPEAGTECSLTPSTLVNVTAGDYYAAELYQTSGAALNTATAGAPFAADLHLTSLGAQATGARAEAAVAQSIPNAAWTQVALDAALFDTGSPAMVDLAGDKLVAPSDGTYALWAGAYLAAAAGVVAPLNLAIRFDGLTYGQSAPGTSAGSWTAWSVTTTFVLRAGQEVTAWIYQGSGAARLLDVAELRPYLAMARIGP